MSEPSEFADGDVLFKAGDADIDLFVVESGRSISSTPPMATAWSPPTGREHSPATSMCSPGRPVIVTAVARGPTRVLRVPAAKCASCSTAFPRLGEKLLNAFIGRREVLARPAHAGPEGRRARGRCKDTASVREFLYKNFVPFTWFDTQTPEGQKQFEAAGSPKKTPVIELRRRGNPAESLAAGIGAGGGNLAGCARPRRSIS